MLTLQAWSIGWQYCLTLCECLNIEQRADFQKTCSPQHLVACSLIQVLSGNRILTSSTSEK